MFIEERHALILQKLNKHERIEVLALSEEFEVSDDSIRRDLKIMEQKGLLKRTHGGAVLPGKVAECAPFSDRLAIRSEAKNRIAREAAELINNGETLLLDGSTTVGAMIPYLAEKTGLTVITNSVYIANAITELTADISLIMIGGKIQKDSMNTVGVEAVTALNRFRVDRSFIAPCAISDEMALYSTSQEESFVKEAMIQIAKSVVILAEQSKFGSSALAKFGEVVPSFTIITDGELVLENPETMNRLKTAGLKMIEAATFGEF